MSMRYRALLIVLLLAPVLARAQRAESIHELESRRHSEVGSPNAGRADGGGESLEVDGERTEPSSQAVPLAPRAMPLAKRVFGWVPYWISSTQWARFDWSALTAIGYFSLEADSTGVARSVRGWPAPALRDSAHARGVKVILTVTSFGDPSNRALLSDAARRTRLVQTIVDSVVGGGGDGVNIDFEVVPGAQRDNLTAFMRELATTLRAEIPAAEISMAIPAVDWSSAFDAVALTADGVCDYLIMMGYDYHWRNSPTAGPVAPLAGENLNVTRSVDTWLATGMTPSKLLLGVPWYGYEWPTVDQERGSAVTGEGRAILYGDARTSAATYGRLFDEPTSTPWYRFTRRDAWYQGWYDDSLSLALKYRLVNDRGLGGIGIWALGYQGDAVDVWQGIHQAFDLPMAIADDGAAHAPHLAVDGSSITFTVAKAMRVRIELHDVLGRRVATIVDGDLGAGTHRASLPTEALRPGVYLVTGNTFAPATSLIVRR